MRKSFFKKLSLGMALALVLGTTAHAGVAQAAETWTLKKDSKILYLNEDNQSNTKNFYDFNFKNKPENWKKDYSFAWSIADEEVATVAKGGVVTAVSVGKTVVSCTITNKETKEVVDVVSADVTVKANAAEVVINNAADYGTEYGWFIPTGTTIDLNRTMFDENGNSTTKRGVYVSDYTRWLATDMDGNVVAEDVVAVNQAKGEFTFNVAGSYYLWCETYQSATNSDTTAYDYFAVTVADEEIEIEAVQNDLESFKVLFSTGLDATEFVKADFDAALEVVNADENTELVKGTELIYNEDKTLVTGVKVTLWNEFEHGKVYTVTCGEVETAFTASVGKANSIVITVAKTGNLDAAKDANVVYVETDGKVEDNTLAIAFKDAAGIDVTKKDRTGNLVFEYDGDVDFFEFNEDTLKLVAYEDAAGKQLKITVKYVEIDDEGEDVVVATGSIVVTAKAAPATELTSIVVGVISKENGTPVYDDKQAEGHKTVIAANDENLYIAVSAKDNWGNKLGNDSGANNEVGYFTFAVNNDQIAAIGEDDGYFTPFTEGTVRVDIFYTDLSVDEPKAVRVARHVVTIKENREPAKLKVEDNSLDLVANVLKGEDVDTPTTNIEQTATFKFTVEDNHGQAVAGLDSDAFVITCDNAAIKEAFKNANVVWNDKDKVYELKVTNTDLIPAITADEATVKKTTVNVSVIVSLADKDNAAAQKKVTVSVKKPANDTITSYTVEVADIDAGMKNTNNAKVDIVVYGLNNNGVKVAKIEALDDYVYGNMKDYVKVVTDKDGNKILPPAEKLFNGVATGTALVYTITKGNTQINPIGNAKVSVATGGSMKLESGEVVKAVNTVSGSSIYVATEAEEDNLVYVAKTGEYTVTVYEITKSVNKNNEAEYKQVKKASDTFKVTDNKMAFKGEQVKTSTSVASLDGIELGKKLDWTDNATVRAIVLDCFKFTLDGKDNEADTEAETNGMAFEVRANGNTLYVKSVRLFKSVENDQFVVLETQLNKTITIAE